MTRVDALETIARALTAILAAGLDLTLRMVDRLEQVDGGASRGELRRAIDAALDISGPTER